MHRRLIVVVFAGILAGVWYFHDKADDEQLKQALFALPATSWLDLMPPEDLKALEEIPEIIHDSEELAGGFTAQDGLRQSSGLPEVMYSSKTVAEMDGKIMRLGGYPVPLEMNDQGEVTEFFLVPYPGACIHVPPPPPNQLIWVQAEKPFKVENIYYPIWVVGTLKIRHVSNQLGDAAYTMQSLAIREVTEEEADLY